MQQSRALRDHRKPSATTFLSKATLDTVTGLLKELKEDLLSALAVLALQLLAHAADLICVVAVVVGNILALCVLLAVANWGLSVSILSPSAPGVC